MLKKQRRIVYSYEESKNKKREMINMSNERLEFLTKSLCDNIERIADALEAISESQKIRNELLEEIDKSLNGIYVEM